MNRLLKGLSYTFHRNLGIRDRLIRVVVALAVLLLWLVGWIPGIIGTVSIILAVMIFGTAISARCGINYWLKINTMTANEKAKLNQQGIKYE